MATLAATSARASAGSDDQTCSGRILGGTPEGGVGRATMTAVVGSCLSVLVADYLLAIVLFRIVFEKT